MEKSNVKGRQIKFLSKKNNTVIYVHSKEQKIFAEILEKDPDVKSYETLKLLEKEQYIRINPINIRKEYFEIEWTSDFIIYYNNGQAGVREVVSLESLSKKANIEKLELSRRYWWYLDIKDWKMVAVGGTEYVLSDK